MGNYNDPSNPLIHEFILFIRVEKQVVPGRNEKVHSACVWAAISRGWICVLHVRVEKRRRPLAILLLEQA
jgi:hypothetical protein